MNQREAMRTAHKAAWRILQSSLDTGIVANWCEDRFSEEDGMKIEKAIDTIIQQHFERGHES